MQIETHVLQKLSLHLLLLLQLSNHPNQHDRNAKPMSALRLRAFHEPASSTANS